MLNSPATKKKRRSPVRREDIVDAAAKLFSEGGYDGTSVRTIAGEVGLSVASIFHHVASKEELLEAVIQRGIELGMADIDAALEGKTTPLGRLRALVHAHIHLVNGDRRHIHRVWTVEWLKLSESARARLEMRSAEYRDIIQDTMRLLFDNEYIFAEPDLSGHLLMPALNWTRTWIHSPPDKCDRELVDSICAAFLNLPVDEFRKRLNSVEGCASDVTP
ncbi:TetR/AcrR family transcriptional regulator [Aurantiacibacter atlanticus]|nr:TetR/AcrR family transcriptional regulator [Aurantiacibacter atlanticus]